jgi:hypothetical protein
VPLAKKEMMELVGAHQVRRSADRLDFVPKPIAEFDGRPDPKTTILQADNHAAGRISKPIKINVVSVEHPNVFGDWNERGHQERSGPQREQYQPTSFHLN